MTGIPGSPYFRPSPRLAIPPAACLMPFVETEYPNDAIRGGGQLDVAATAPLLNGQKVCVIGHFLAMTQADVVEVVRRHGGLLVGYPSPDTSLVVVGGDGWPCLRDGSPYAAGPPRAGTPPG